MRPDLDAALARLGYDEFRPGQREAIETLLEARRLLLVAPTGGGKSLVYQLPATLLDGTTLVVSPLISLMQDQVSALAERGVPATYLASTVEVGELSRRLADAARGRYRILYIAPERVSSSAFQRLLPRLDCPLVAIDEAHCISEWGHDFRPEYLALSTLVSALRGARVLACTATATPVVRDEIASRLGLGPETPQLVRGFARPNLVLRAREVTGPRDRSATVDALLAEALGSPGRATGTAIVYSPTRRRTERESLRLARAGWRAAAYHAGLEARERDSVQKRFSRGDLEVVVATNAFGMGIDRADVRAVVHLGPPGSVEAYYQEVGRAGRDGQRAYGLLLSSSQDLALRRTLIESSPSGDPVAPEIVEHKWSLFLELMRWAEGGSCRHDAILRYFGDEDEVLRGCGQCDVCTDLEAGERIDEEQTTIIVRKALSGVARIHGRFGLQTAVRLLRGARDRRLEQAGLARVRTFGALSDHTEQWLTQLLRRCVTAGWVSFSRPDRPVALITESGRAVMAGRAPARLVLPPTRASPGAGHRPDSRARAASSELLDGAARSLFEELRAHRLDVARTEGVPAYVVASDRTLRDLANIRPRNTAELLGVHGFGATKTERYGSGFLTVIERHSSG